MTGSSMMSADVRAVLAAAEALLWRFGGGGDPLFLEVGVIDAPHGRPFPLSEGGDRWVIRAKGRPADFDRRSLAAALTAATHVMVGEGGTDLLISSSLSIAAQGARVVLLDATRPDVPAWLRFLDETGVRRVALIQSSTDDRD